MSATPRTDEAAIGFARLLVDRDKRTTTELLEANFARQLERDLAAMTKRAEEAERDAERMLRNERAFHHLLACVQRAQSFDPEITKYPDDELSPYDVLAKGVREALDISHGEDAARGKNG